SMTNTAIASDFYQSLDVQCDLTAQITFHLHIVVDVLTQFGNVILAEISHPCVRIDACRLDNVLSFFAADTIDVGKANLDPLLSGQVNTSYTCHITVAPPSILFVKST